MTCKFCDELGHFTRSCAQVVEYITAGKIVRGPDNQLYMSDGSDIPQVPGGWYLKDAIDRTFANQQKSVPASFAERDPPPHMATNILTAAYPDTSALMEIDPSAFMTTIGNLE